MTKAQLFGSGNASNVLIILLIIVVVFTVIRELITWYWKINKVVDLLEQIEENTRPKDIVREEKDKWDKIL